MPDLAKLSSEGHLFRDGKVLATINQPDWRSLWFPTLLIAHQHYRDATIDSVASGQLMISFGWITLTLVKVPSLQPASCLQQD